jgi:hypothetical protein
MHYRENGAPKCQNESIRLLGQDVVGYMSNNPDEVACLACKMLMEKDGSCHGCMFAKGSDICLSEDECRRNLKDDSLPDLYKKRHLVEVDKLIITHDHRV